MEERIAGNIHKLQLTQRRTGTLTGILEVRSFDTGEVLLETEQGLLQIKGKELRVKGLNLEKGEVEIEGIVDSFSYSDLKGHKDGDETFFGRLFK